MIALNRNAAFLLFFAFLAVVPVFSKSLEKAVKNHIEDLDDKYPLKKWDKKIGKTHKKLRKISAKFYRNPSEGVKDISYKSMMSFKEDVDALLDYEKNLYQLIQDLSTPAICRATFPRTARAKSLDEIREKAQLERWLKNTERDRKEKKIQVYNNLQQVKLDFEKWQADWLYHYSRHALFKTVRQAFEKQHFSDNGKIYDEFVYRVNDIKKTIKNNPDGAIAQLRALRGKVHIPVKHVEELEGLLTPEMLYGGILAHAADEEVDFTMKAEEKIESILQGLSQQNLKAVYMRKGKWDRLKDHIDYQINRAQDHIAYLKRKEKNREMMEAKVAALGNNIGALEDDELEEEQKELMEARNASRNIMNMGFEKTLSKNTGQLKTTKVGSASKKLEVKVNKFDEKLSKTDGFNFNVKSQANFDRISSSEKSSNSLYTYQAKNGRADKNDLKDFVNEVGLISFGSLDEFISYKLPHSWKPQKRVRWQKEKRQEEEKNLDREFTYVELFTEAHKVRTQKEPISDHVSKTYIPPNMIVIFDSGGGIVRYETFSDIDRVRIKSSDVINGNVYYKFLNYSVNGSRIQLRGIDHEVKMANL